MSVCLYQWNFVNLLKLTTSRSYSSVWDASSSYLTRIKSVLSPETPVIAAEIPGSFDSRYYTGVTIEP